MSLLHLNKKSGISMNVVWPRTANCLRRLQDYAVTSMMSAEEVAASGTLISRDPPQKIGQWVRGAEQTICFGKASCDLTRAHFLLIVQFYQKLPENFITFKFFTVLIFRIFALSNFYSWHFYRHHLGRRDFMK